MKISAVIITFNEEGKIADAIRSVEWADEILVVDSESTDHTREIAVELGARVIVEKWRGFSGQKQLATDQALYDRIFSLDADERVSEELKDEILKIRESGLAADGYRIPRLTNYLGRNIRHCGWYPDWQLRFFDRTKGKWKNVAVHESIEMAADAKVSKLNGDILHFSIDSVKQHAEMINSRYAPLSAAAMYDSGKRASFLKIALLPGVTFLQTYLVKGGFLDGLTGFVISYFAAYNVFLKHLFLWERQNQSKKL